VALLAEVQHGAYAAADHRVRYQQLFEEQEGPSIPKAQEELQTPEATVSPLPRSEPLRSLPRRPGRYFVRIGEFHQAEEVRGLMATLERQGLTPWLDVRRIQGKGLFELGAGSWDDRADAETELALIRQAVEAQADSGAQPVLVDADASAP